MMAKALLAALLNAFRPPLFPVGSRAENLTCLFIFAAALIAELKTQATEKCFLE
jgi:hypothetical protein